MEFIIKATKDFQLLGNLVFQSQNSDISPDFVNWLMKKKSAEIYFVLTSTVSTFPYIIFETHLQLSRDSHKTRQKHVTLLKSRKIGAQLILN